MDKNKILIVTHEMDPYVALSSAAELVRSIPKPAQSADMDVRILMPRFGTINERRHRLHEVVRLSGINIVVNDEDYPLIIKVASLPGARLQVYFLDNDEFYKRKAVFENKKTGEAFEDNDERMIFFAQGVLETVKQFGWPPNIIHLHGWMSSLIPLYLRKAYFKEPVFADTKIIYSAYPKQFEGDFGTDFVKKAQINDLITEEDLAIYNNGDSFSLNIGAMNYADKAIIADDVEKDYSDDVDSDKIALQGDETITPEAIVSLYKSLIGVEENKEEDE